MPLGACGSLTWLASSEIGKKIITFIKNLNHDVNLLPYMSMIFKLVYELFANFNCYVARHRSRSSFKSRD